MESVGKKDIYTSGDTNLSRISGLAKCTQTREIGREGVTAYYVVGKGGKP